MKTKYSQNFISNFFGTSRLVGMGRHGGLSSKRGRSAGESAAEAREMAATRAPDTIVDKNLRQKYVDEIIRAKKMLKKKGGIKKLEIYKNSTYSQVTSLGSGGQEIITRNEIVHKVDRMMDVEKKKIVKRRPDALVEAEDNILTVEIVNLKRKAEKVAKSGDKIAFDKLITKLNKKRVEAFDNSKPLVGVKYSKLSMYAHDKWAAKSKKKPLESKKMAKEVAGVEKQDLNVTMMSIEKKLEDFKKKNKGNMKNLGVFVEKLKTKHVANKVLVKEISAWYTSEKKDALKSSIAIPQQLVAEVKGKLTKRAVGIFLDDINDLGGKNYKQKRVEFKKTFLSDSEFNSGLVTMAMQKSLSVKVDGKIGPNTITALKKNVFADNEVDVVMARKEKVAASKEKRFDTYKKRVDFLKKKVDYSKVSMLNLAKLESNEINEYTKTDIIINEAIKQKKLNNDRTLRWLNTGERLA